MITPSCGIAPEGKPFIYFSAFAAAIFAVLHSTILAVLCLFFCAFSIYFFRDPERVVPSDPFVAVSPADGRILHVWQRKDPIEGKDMLCISIFMNIFNVHVNRVPVDCTVSNLTYFPGKFFNASFDKASEFNERCCWKLTDKDNEIWYMVQIAGLIARRIVIRAQVGDTLDKGVRCGLIRFGSRVDLYLPASYHVQVREGDIVFAGQSILAKKQ